MVIDASFVKRHIKPKADSTLLNMKKADLVEYIRTLEHNHNVAVSFNEQQARNVEDMMKNGMTFAKDTDVPSKWIRVEDETPDEFISVIGHRTDAGDFPAVRECYWVGNGFFFPALREMHPVDKWMPLPEPPKEDLDAKKGGAAE